MDLEMMDFSRRDYGSADLDAVHIWVMKVWLGRVEPGVYRRLEDGALFLEAPRGLLSHPALDGFLHKAAALKSAAQPPEVMDIILESEYQILARGDLSAPQLVVLNAIRVLVPGVLQRAELPLLHRYMNLWHNTLNDYAQEVFYPALRQEDRDALELDTLPVISAERFIPIEMQTDEETI